MGELDRGRARSERVPGRRSGSDTALAPGKLTLTQGLGSPSAPVELVAALASAQEQTTALAAAIATADFQGAWAEAVELRRTLARAREVGAASPADAMLLQQAEAAARPVLAVAPAPSAAAVGERLASAWQAARPQWDVEEQQWMQARGVTAAPRDVAARGVLGIGEVFPFRAQIQASFGRHDLSDARAHTDAPAASAAGALGARAFALGDRVAFAGTPDLHTAAHEAAHVVQQRGGVALASDPHEAHADEVADAVVAGRSAEGLLDRHGGAAGAARQAVVQRKADTAPPPASPAKTDVAWAYLRANEEHFVAAIQKRLTGFLPAAHPRLAWLPGGCAPAFPQALAGVLGGDQLFIRLPELAHPIDPWYVIDQNRALVDGAPGVVVAGKEPTGPLAWNPLAGEALAIQLVARLRESFERMAPRYAAQLDASKTVAVADLVASHPLDRVVARLLCDDRVVRPVPPGRGHKRGKDPSLFPDGVRMLDDWHWLGDQNPALWNWIEVRAPRNATREDLAATLWMDVDASYRAFGITGAAPYFRVDPSWARTFDDARKHAPEGLDKRDEDGLALAESSFATDAAVAQAANERKFDKHGIPLPADTVRLATVLETSSRQIDRAKELLTPWRLWEPLLPAIHWVASYREHLLAVPAARLIGLAPAIEGQQGILFEAVGALQDVCDTAGSAAAADGDNGPIAGVLRAYAIAIGESHLIDSARAQMATARRAKSGMALVLLERSLHESHEAVRDLASNETEPSFETKTADANNATFQRQLVDMRAKQSAGEAIDEADVELLAAHVKEQAFDARARSLSRQLWNLENEAGDAKSGGYETLASVFGDHGDKLGAIVAANGVERPAGSDFGGLAGRLAAMARDLDESVIQARSADKATRNNIMATQLRDVGGAQEKKSRASVVNESVRYGEQRLATFVADHKLDKIIQNALSQIDDQHRRTIAFQIVIQMGLLIGVSLVGGVVGNMVAGAVRGSLLADAAVASAGMLRSVQTAQTLGTIAGIATDAAVNAGGQVLLAGGSGSDTFIDNLISSAAIRVALAPLHKLASTWGAAEQNLKNLNLWEKTAKRGFILRKGIVLTAEMITGAAINYAVQKARHSGQAPDEKTAVDWAVEGASMAIGAFASHQLAGLDSRLVQMAEHGTHLRARAKRLRALAARVEQTGDKSAALDLLISHHELLLEEAEQISHLEALSKGKITAQTRRTLEAGNKAELGGVHDKAFATMPLRFAGLAPDDASGKVWVGAAEDIEPAIDQATRAGLHVQVIDRDIGGRKWRIRYEGDELTILETEPHDHQPSERAPTARTRQAEKPGVIEEPKKDPEKTREDDQHQLKKPDEESLEEANARRSQPLKPKTGSDEAWASPQNRHGIPEEVPLTRQELRDIVTAKYGKTIAKYLTGEHTANPEYLLLMRKMEAEPPGFATKTDAGKKRLAEYIAEQDRITPKVGDAEAATELRSVYNLVEKEDMREVWAPKLKDLPMEQQAKLLSMYREELKLFVREMMPDTNASEILMLRDRGLYGDRRGGRFDEFVAKGLNGRDQKSLEVSLENATQAQKDAAYQKVIDSSMRSNEAFNLRTTGTKDGIDPEVGKQIRTDANDVTTELPKVRAANVDAIAAEKVEIARGIAKTNQEGNETRRKEIHLGSDKPAQIATHEGLRGELDELDDLRSALKKAMTDDEQAALKEKIKQKKEALDTKLADPAQKEALLDPSVSFALQREAASGDHSDTLKKFLSTNIEGVLASQKQSRQGVDPDLRAKREIFEREFALRVLKDGPIKKAVDANLDHMCQKALSYLEKTRAAHEMDGTLSGLGLEAKDGYAGAVLPDRGDPKKMTNAETFEQTKKEGAIMRDVLTSGNARERMIALGKFAELIAKDMINDPTKMEKAARPAKEGKTAPGEFTGEDAKRYQERMAAYMKDRGLKPGDAIPTPADPKKDATDEFTKDFLKPTKDEKAGSQKAYQDAKNQGMDTKLPSVEVRNAATFEGAPTKQTDAGERSTLARTSMTVKEAQAMGYQLSAREIAAAGGPDGKLPWIGGTIANTVDPTAEFIRTATEKSLPQKAGISGTTFRFMEAATLLGGRPNESRLAMIGALQVIDAHTVYEIASAAQGFGLPYNPARPYDGLGISPTILEGIAKSTGTTLDELNGHGPTPGPKKERGEVMYGRSRE